jgi:hypothetical protein
VEETKNILAETLHLQFRQQSKALLHQPLSFSLFYVHVVPDMSRYLSVGVAPCQVRGERDIQGNSTGRALEFREPSSSKILLCQTHLCSSYVYKAEDTWHPMKTECRASGASVGKRGWGQVQGWAFALRLELSQIQNYHGRGHVGTGARGSSQNCCAFLRRSR